MNFDYNSTDLEQCLQGLGVNEGDCIFFHSALKSLGKFDPAPNEATFDQLLSVLRSCVGREGSIVVPTFNFAFCHGAIFDYDNTPCDGMGAFSEFIRTHRDAIRANHPFHSVSGVGKITASLASAQAYSEFSEGSFFDLLLKLQTKIVFFGIDFVETFAHIAEERAKVPYRFWKVFNGIMVKQGISSNISVNFYARMIDSIPEPLVDVPKLEMYLRDSGVISSSRLGSGLVSICNSNEMVDRLTIKFREDPLFALKEECL